MALASTPPVIVVLDLNTLASLSPAEWLEFGRVGKVILPQAIYEEIRLAFDRSPDPDIEAISRAFHRMYASSGWETSEATAHHPDFKPPSGQAVTKRTRLSLSAARCAFALSQSHPASMVVLVTTDRNLLPKLQTSPEINLSGITPQEALQWSRTGQRTASVLHKVHQLRGLQGISTTSSKRTSATRTPAATRKTTAATVGGTTATAARTLQRSPIRPARVSSSAIQQVVSLGMSLLAVLLAGWLAWSLFQQFYQNQSQNQRPPQQQQQ